jgi:hypothetical protein
MRRKRAQGRRHNMSCPRDKCSASAVFADEGLPAAKMTLEQHTHAVQMDNLSTLVGQTAANQRVTELAASFQRVLDTGGNQRVTVLSVVEEGGPRDSLFGTVWSVQVTPEDTADRLAVGFLLRIACACAAGGVRTGVPVHVAILRTPANSLRARLTLLSTGARVLDSDRRPLNTSDAIDQLVDMVLTKEDSVDVSFVVGTRGLASIADNDRVLFTLAS